MKVNCPDDGGEHRKEYRIVLGVLAGLEQVALAIGYGPVAVLAASVDALERLFVQKAGKSVALGGEAQHLHDHHVVVDGEVQVLEHRSELELRRSDLVVAGLGGDAEPPELFVHLLHELQDSRAYRAVVVVLELLMFRRGGSEHGAPRLQQVRTLHVVRMVDEEVFLLSSERHGNVRLRLAEEPHQTFGGAAHRLHGAQERRLGVERIARIGAEDGGDAERGAVRMSLDERRRRWIPRSVAASLERGTQPSRREGRRIRFAADEIATGETNDHAGLRGHLYETVVLLSGAAGKRLEPVRKMSGPLREGPRLHRLGDIVRNGRVKRFGVAHRGKQFRRHLLGKEAFYHLCRKHIVAVSAESVGNATFILFHGRKLYHIDRLLASSTHQCTGPDSNIAAGVFTPDVAGDGLSPGAEIASADIQPATCAATALHKFLLPAHQV